MSTRFHLRFVGGDRDGELVPVPRSGLLVGRRPGNDLRLEAGSVSGRHALLRADDEGLRVEDMGSTNGTRVDGEQIETASVAHGQRVVFGDVAFEVVDSQAVPALQETAREPRPPEPEPGGGLELEDEIELGSAAPSDAGSSDEGPAGSAPPAAVPAQSLTPRPTAPRAPAAPKAPAPTAPAPADDAFEGDTLGTVDEALLERTRGSGAATWIVAAVLLAGGGAAAWMFLSGGDETAREVQVAAPLERDGDLLPGGDLETGAETFLTTVEGSIELFGEPWAAASGGLGLGGEFLPGDRLLARSAAVAVRSGQTWSAAAELRTTDGLTAALGLELFANDGSRSTQVWGAAVGGDGEWRSSEVTARVRSGFDRARLWLAAGPREGGDETPAELAVDDLGLVPGQVDTAAEVEQGAFEIALWQPDRRGLTVFHAFAPLFELRTGDVDAPARPGARLTLDPTGPHPRVATGDGSGALWIELQPRLADGAARAVATQGEGGYRRRSGDFEDDAVDALVLGEGATLVRLRLDAPAAVRATGGARQRLLVELPDGAGLQVQTDFSAELAAVIELTSRARSAEREGRVGDALALWSELASDYPFEAEYLREAETRRAALLGEGLEALRALEVELERARFFALSGVYAQCEERARALLDRFRPELEDAPASEVVTRAEGLLASIRAERSELGLGAEGLEPERRARILGWVERNGAERLAERVRADG